MGELVVDEVKSSRDGNRRDETVEVGQSPKKQPPGQDQ